MKQLVRPSQLKPPILLARLGMEIEELDPRTVWGEVGGWIGSGGHGDDEEDMERKWVFGEQLVNSAGNQSRRFILEGLNSLTNKIFIEEWFRIASTLPRLEFSSPSIAWGKNADYRTSCSSRMSNFRPLYSNLGKRSDVCFISFIKCVLLNHHYRRSRRLKYLLSYPQKYSSSLFHAKNS